MKSKAAVVLLFIMAIGLVNAQELKSPKFGKGLFNLVGKDSSWTMKIGARMQFLTSVSAAEDRSPRSNFLIRRARLKFDGFAFSPKLEYKIELGLSNRDIGNASQFTNNAPRYILDAVLKWNFYENFVLWAGQTKLPGNRERVISSANMQQVDRSLLNARFNIDRDVGFQLRHHINFSENFVVREIFAFSQGEGRNITVGNLGGYQYTGRIEVLPFGNFTSKGDYFGSDLKREPKPKLSVAATYDLNSDAVKTRSNLGSFMVNDTGFYQTDISTIFIDAMFKYRGFSFMFEYADRDADDPIAKNSDGTETGAIVQVGTGVNFQSGYLFKNNWEVSGRYSNAILDEDVTGRMPEHQYTLGVSKFLAGHSLKVQSDMSLIQIDGLNDQFVFRLQVDMHF